MAVGSIIVLFVTACLGEVAFAGGPYFTDQACLTELGWLELDGNCYKLAESEVSQDDAISACITIGPFLYRRNSPSINLGLLADINSKKENDFVADVVAKGNRAWIGGTRVGDTFKWLSLDMYAGPSDMTYTNWKPNEPSNTGGTEDCVEINRGPPGAWNDLYCNRLLPAVCKYTLADVVYET